MKFFTKILFLFLSGLLVAFLHVNAQVSFTNSNSQLQGATHSGCPITVVDVNGDGLDDIVRLDQGHRVYIDYQRPGHQFDHYLVGDFGYSSGWAWGMCVADADHNGFKDVLAGGGGPAVELLLLDATGTGGTIYSLPSSYFFLQNLNFMDVNNDGWEDIFGCDDNAQSHIWVNDGSGGFTVSGIIDFNVTNTDDSGNYGSVWSDFDNDGDVDFYIAKCRQGVSDPSDGRRIDVLFVNDGSNNYTSDAASYGLADSGETWTCNFSDIDNDGDLDAIQVDQDVPAKLLENDGTGHMTNITIGSGFDVSDLYPLESVMEDFDNDGYVDIFVTGGGDPDFFHNNGDHTFTPLNGLFDANQIESFAVGDLNHDGKIDLYTGYAGVYTNPSGIDDVYWLNTTNNGNHFITFNLIGVTSTVGAYGARVTLYGSWGTQVREVHAGESYGTCNTTNLHFGLGTATSIDSAIVRWPSGTITTITTPAIDQFMTVKENTCVSPDFSISTSDTLVFCIGHATLLASALPAGYSYLWTNDSTTQSIDVTTTGNYYCTAVSANDACSVTSLPISVVVNPPSIPTITVSGDLTFCNGGSVTLTSSPSASYTWSTGENTQSIYATQPGYYTVATPGMCQAWSSDSIFVNVLIPPPPVTTNDYLGEPGMATVTATGDTISWYDVAVGGSPIATGNSYTTYVSVTDTFYAEDQKVYGADSLNGGQIYHEGGLYSVGVNTNNTIIFDVFKACILKSVKVYTDHPGNRLVELRNSNGNTIQSAMVYVPLDSNRITLNFDLTPGTDYELGTNAAQNNILLGTDGPRLQRSNEGVNYPYLFDSLVSLTGYSGGTDYYYYFYDWEVMKIPLICISARTPAIVNISTGIQVAGVSALQLFPNPTEGQVIIKSDEVMAETVSMQVLDVTGKQLLSRIEEGMKPGEEIQLDLSVLPKGIYFLNIESGSNTMQHKVVVQ